MNNIEKSLLENGVSIFTKIACEILVPILEKVKSNVRVDENGQEIHYAKFEFKEAGDLTDFTNKKVRKIEKIFDKLLDTQIELSSEDFYKRTTLFSKYCFKKDSTVELFLSEGSFIQLVLEKENYGIVEIDKLSKLKTNYSKEFYCLFSKVSHSGILNIKKEHLFNILGIPDYFEDIDFIDEALNPSVEELEKYFEGLTLSNFETNSTGELPSICKFTFKKDTKRTSTKRNKKKPQDEIELLNHIMNS